MKKIIPMILLIILLSGCKSPEKQYNDGVSAMNDQDWDTAIECFTDNPFSDSSELLEKCKAEKGMHEKADYRFLDAMASGLMKRFEISGSYLDDLDICISTELEYISKFKNEEFYDKNLQNLYFDYLDGLILEQESLDLPLGQQKLKYYEGHAKRFSTLKSLTDNYGFLNDNVDYKVHYYNKADKEVEYYNAYKAIEDDLSVQLTDDVKSIIIDESTTRIIIKNNTDYSYDLLLCLTFMDENGTILDAYDNYFDNIKPHANRNLDFYFPPNTIRFEYYTEEYNIK